MKTALDSESALNAKPPIRQDARLGARNSFRFGAAILLGLVLTPAAARGQLVPIPLECQRTDNHLVLSWTNAAFSLQCARAAHGVFTNVPGATSPHTNALSGAECYFRLLGVDSTPGMALIPAGSFTMGDSFSEGTDHERPTHTVYVSAFYMDKCEVTKALWDEVYQWATNHGYSFGSPGYGKATNHPVVTIFWHDTVKWCNARSEKEGLTPSYYTNAAKTIVYRTGQVDVQNDWVKWNTGYRLPTEAEWEKAARGGASGKRYPWSDADTISHSRANYESTDDRWGDVSSTRGYHPTFNDGVRPYTSPVGYFAANGYGLYDMAGNVEEWCWDRYSGTYYSVSPGTDPRGPTTGSSRPIRGGAWNSSAYSCRAAFRYGVLPGNAWSSLGFRSALPPSQ